MGGVCGSALQHAYPEHGDPLHAYPEHGDPQHGGAEHGDAKRRTKVSDLA
jgi:hypothetical protein